VSDPTAAPDTDLTDALGRLSQGHVLVLGDVMLDRNVMGAVERVSPEAPVPVLRIDHEDVVPGGAGNVVRNLAALGAKVTLVGVRGNDTAGQTLAQSLGGLGGVTVSLVIDPARPTTIKTRYRAGGQQLLRADRESNAPITGDIAKALIAAAYAALDIATVVLISDYAKGVLTDAVLTAVMAAARSKGIPVLVDPKRADFKVYRGARLVTPNRGELRAASGRECSTVELTVEAARAVAAKAGIEGMLVTLSQDGMVLVDGAAAPLAIPAQAREVFDVSGAGDTAIATLAAALAGGASLPVAARLANLAAGLVVAKAGTATVHADEIEAALARATTGGKILGLDAAMERIAAWRRQGLKIGFTNGCFDLLHPGHVALLDFARAACDRLVVGLNADASVRRLKGTSRPVQGEAARATVLSSLAAVDLVAIFAEDTPLRLIEALRPDILVKGADYRREQVVGGDLVEGWGGRVLLAPILDGHSTSGTIGRMGGGGA